MTPKDLPAAREAARRLISQISPADPLMAELRVGEQAEAERLVGMATGRVAECSRPCGHLHDADSLAQVLAQVGGTVLVDLIRMVTVCGECQGLAGRMFATGAPRRAAPHAGGSRYGLAALRREIADVRRALVGARNNRLNRAAFCLGMLAAGGELDEGLVEAELLAAALDTGLPEAEAQASIRSGLRAGAREPRRRPAS